MATLTIRQLSDETKRRLRIRAANHGWSMEEEVREILRGALAEEGPPANLADAVRARLGPLGGVDLVPLERESIRRPPKL